MLHAKFHWNQSTCSRQEEGFLGHVTWKPYFNQQCSSCLNYSSSCPQFGFASKDSSDKVMFLNNVRDHFRAYGSPRGLACMDPNVMVGRIYKEEYYTLLHTNYESSGLCGFREVFYVSHCMSMRANDPQDGTIL